jgi:hypothetical protein
MSEQVQVREGVWRTRAGEEIEVRANHTANAAEFPWRGMLCGVSEIWHDDGRWRISGGDHYRDLVQYVGPLPEPEPLPQQTTTDTLAEIEEQTCETLQEALGRALEQAYIADLKKAIDAVTADRDRLQQQLADMTKHSRELLESAQQAHESQERLQRLEAMTAERDQLRDLETLRRQFAAMTADRDRLQAELARETESLQNERFQTQQAHAGCKRAEEHLEEVTADVQRLTAELRQAQIDLDAERETSAANRRAIAEGHLIGAQTGRQAAFEAVERWLEPLAGVDSEHAAAVLQALPGCIRKLAELEGVTW